MGLLDKIFKREPRKVVYQPAIPRSDADRHPVVNLQQIELLVPQQVMAQNVTTDQVTRLVRATEECARQTLAHSLQTFGLRVRYTIYTDRSVGIDLGVNVPMDQAELQPTYDAINRLDAVHIQARHHPVGLYAYFTVNQLSVE